MPTRKSSIEQPGRGARASAVNGPTGPLGARLRVIFHAEPEGGYSVEVPALRGCFTEGDTLAEAVANAREAIAGWLEAAQSVNEGEADEQAIVMEIPL